MTWRCTDEKSNGHSMFGFVELRLHSYIRRARHRWEEARAVIVKARPIISGFDKRVEQIPVSEVGLSGVR